MKNIVLLLKIFALNTLGLNRAKYSKDKKTKSKQSKLSASVLFGAAIIFLMVLLYCWLMSLSLAPAGLLHIMLTIMVVCAAVTVLITTIFKTNGLLFGFTDYDLQMSLPISGSAIITSRILILYFTNLLFTLALMIPAFIIYAINVAVPPLFVVIYFVLSLFVPLIPVVIATVIGSLVAIASSKFRRKNIAGIVLGMVAMLAMMIGIFSLNISGAWENFDKVGVPLASMLSQFYPPAALFAQSIMDYNIGSFLLFIGISAAVFIAFVLIVGKNFKKINSMITASATRGKYSMKALSVRSQKKALYQKELKRYFSSAPYVMNTAIGPILLLIFAIVVMVMGEGSIAKLLRIPEAANVLAGAIPLLMAFFVIMSCTASASISLEGQNFWLLRSLPVHTKDIFWAKLKVNFVVILPAALISGVLICIGLRPPFLNALFIILLPFVAGVFTSLFGLYTNLKHIFLDWTSEVIAVKQSTSTMIVVFTGMGITFVPMFFAFALGPYAVYICMADTILMAALSFGLYRSLMRKGVQLFETFGGESNESSKKMSLSGKRGLKL